MEQTYQEMIGEMRSRWIADLTNDVANEREWLRSGAGKDIRTLRLIAFRTIRWAQRRLAEIANELVADAAQGGAA